MIIKLQPGNKIEVPLIYPEDVEEGDYYGLASKDEFSSEVRKMTNSDAKWVKDTHTNDINSAAILSVWKFYTIDVGVL
jgi:hypothetical protein